MKTNPPQARALVDRMQAIWPNPRWSSQTTAEYERVLVGVEHDVCLAALENLRDTLKRRPTIADVQAANRACAATSAKPRHRDFASQPGMPSKERVREIVEATKAQAAEAGAHVKTLGRAS